MNNISIVGNGLIANKFKTLSLELEKPVTIFASGVSNSEETNLLEFKREEILLKNQNKNNKIIYFSTCSLLNEANRNNIYVKKKIYFEKMIAKIFDDYLIIRLPQVVGKGGNKNNLVNFFYQSILLNKHFVAKKKAYRNLIDVDDVLNITKKIITSTSGAVNVAAPHNTLVLNIIFEIEEILNKKGNYTLINEGTNFKIDIKSIESLIVNYNCIFHAKYQSNLIKKYYEN
jgi:nucleoside-diphosphate-sugar epimerase